MLTTADAIWVEAADVRRVRRAIRVVPALEAAVGVAAVVAGSDVARTAVGGGGEVGRAVLAPIAKPLVGARAMAVRNQAAHVARVLAVAVGEIANAGTGREIVVVFNTTITAQGVRVCGIDGGVDELGARVASASVPEPIAGALAAGWREVATDGSRSSRAIPVHATELVARRER